MTTLAAAPSVYYDAATALSTAATNWFAEVDHRWTALSGCEHMAGTYNEATKWATSYDTRAGDVLQLATTIAEAIDSYAGVLRTMGYNHALAEHDATLGADSAPPDPPPAPLPAVYLCRIPLPSAGGPSNGLEDSGVKLAEKIGITVPNGDTTKLGNIADAWNQIKNAPGVSGLSAELDRVSGMFTEIISPETDFVTADIGQLKASVNGTITAFGELSTACRDHQTSLDKLRADLKAQLEDLGKELAKEVAITAAIGIAASLVTFGIGAAVASARIVAIAARFAAPIRRIIDAWKAEKKLEKGVQIEADLAKHQSDVQHIKQLGEEIKLKDPAKPPMRTDPAGWTQKDTDMLADYTGSGGRELNAALRSGKVSDAQRFRIDSVNEALDKLPNYEGVVTRRVSDMPPEALARYEKGATVTEDAFTSSSANPARAFDGDVEMQIYSKTGKQVAPYSPQNFSEEEVLFRTDTPFTVMNRFTDPDTGRLIIQMVEK